MPNLVTALAEALANAGKATVLSKQAPQKPAPAAGPTAALPDDILLNALRNSLTGRDLIMQRRIGFGHEEQG